MVEHDARVERLRNLVKRFEEFQAEARRLLNRDTAGRQPGEPRHAPDGAMRREKG